jgi:hypothetical protein
MKAKAYMQGKTQHNMKNSDITTITNNTLAY